METTKNTDLNSIPLRSQVNLINLSKKIKDHDELSKRSGIRKHQIKQIICEQVNILRQWRKATTISTKEQVDYDLQEEEDVIHQLLLEWCKRAFWNGNEEVRERQIEDEANILKRALHVSTFRISAGFWEDFRAFKSKYDDNQYRGLMHLPLDIDNILKHCESRIKPNIYAKFKGILDERTPPKGLRTYPIRRRVGKNGCNQNREAAVDDADVFIVERPIECIDVETATSKSRANVNVEMNVKIKNEAICDNEEGFANNSHFCEDISSIVKTEYCDEEDVVSERWPKTSEVGHAVIDPADQDAINQLLVEWTKRYIWNGSKTITHSQIRRKVNEYKQTFNLPTYIIYTLFWDDLSEFMKTLGGKKNEKQQSQDTKTILKHCKKRIHPKTYRKFLALLENKQSTHIETNKPPTVRSYGKGEGRYTLVQTHIESIKEEKSEQCTQIKIKKTPIRTYEKGEGRDTSTVAPIVKTPTESIKVEKELLEDIDFRLKLEAHSDGEKNVGSATSFTIKLHYSSGSDNDVDLIEEPIECIDVTLETFDNNEGASDDVIKNIKLKVEPDIDNALVPIENDFLSVHKEPSKPVDNKIQLSNKSKRPLRLNAPVENVFAKALKKPSTPLDAVQNNKIQLNTSNKSKEFLSTVEEVGCPTPYDEKRYHELVDQLLLQWARRYILNGRGPELQMHDILAQAEMLKQDLNLPNYACKLLLCSTILAEKNVKREEAPAQPKLSLDYLKILCECEFATPSYVYLKCLESFENKKQKAADEKIRQLQEMTDYEACVAQIRSAHRALSKPTNTSVVYSLNNIGNGDESQHPSGDDSSVKISYKGNAKSTSDEMYDLSKGILYNYLKSPHDLLYMPSSSTIQTASKEGEATVIFEKLQGTEMIHDSAVVEEPKSKIAHIDLATNADVTFLITKDCQYKSRRGPARR